MLAGWLEGLAIESFKLNQRNIIDLVAPGPYEAMCDLGCDDGDWTMQLAAAVNARAVHGVEVVKERATMARVRGVEVVMADLNQRLPYVDASFDLVHANQVIEHIADLDVFLSEIHRVLKPGGISLISTENGSSWHNVFAAAMGWQIFSLTNVSPLAGGVGNPLALHRGQPGNYAALSHKTVFNYRGLLEIQKLYGLNPCAVRAAGYHPLPPRVARLDPRHSHILAVKAKKADTTVRAPQNAPSSTDR